MLAHLYICFDIILSASNKIYSIPSAFRTQKPLQVCTIRKEKTFEGHGLQIGLTLFATTEPTSANEVSNFVHTSVFQASWNMVDHNQEFFFNLAVLKVWRFFPILKNCYFKVTLFVPKFFTILSPQFQNSN
jgi:hypothetical protein